MHVCMYINGTLRFVALNIHKSLVLYPWNCLNLYKSLALLGRPTSRYVPRYKSAKRPTSRYVQGLQKANRKCVLDKAAKRPTGKQDAGCPDWAIFRIMGDCFVWAVVRKKYNSRPSFRATFFQGKSYLLILTNLTGWDSISEIF
jgi:hypothetical protein